MSAAGERPTKATLTVGDKTAEFPILHGHRRAPQHRSLHSDQADRPHRTRLRLREHRRDQVGDHVHRRRPGHPALPRLSDRADREQLHLPRDRVAAHLRRAALAGRACGLRRADPPAHPAARGSEALLPGAAGQRAPDGSAVLRGRGPLHVLRERVRPAQPGACRAEHDPDAREAPRDRRLRAQEEHRPGVPVPGQFAELRGQLPQAQLRGAQRAVRDQPGHVQGARAAADPARGPRAERVHVDRAPGGLDRARTSSPRSRPGSRRSPARCTAGRTRPC